MFCPYGNRDCDVMKMQLQPATQWGGISYRPGTHNRHCDPLKMQLHHTTQRRGGIPYRPGTHNRDCDQHPPFTKTKAKCILPLHQHGLRPTPTIPQKPRQNMFCPYTNRDCDPTKMQLQPTTQRSGDIPYRPGKRNRDCDSLMHYLGAFMKFVNGYYIG